MRSRRSLGDLVSNRRVAAALVLLLIAAAISATTRVVLGPPGAVVHLRWQPGLDPAARGRLERRFRLTEGGQLDDRTWRYNLIDVSSENIRAIVDDPSVEDTHHIDRRSYVVTSSAERTARPRRLPVDGDSVVRLGDWFSLALATIGGALLAWATIGASAKSGVARAAAGPIGFLARGIPETTATTAGAFRIVFGVALLWFFAARPENASSLDAAFNPLIEGELHAAVIQWMRAHPYVADALTPWLLISGVAFTAGLRTRFSYTSFVAGAVAWLFVATTHDSTHPHSTLGLTLVALLPSRWGDALSVDSWLRRDGGARARSNGRQYGYSVWVPGLVFGVAFAAAAWAKLTRPPGWSDWILNGSVKYHFITDAHNAPVDWGLLLAGHPTLAVVASLGAVAIEALVITAAFSRSEWYRLAVGMGALSLLAGFRLFMGVFWPGWWILLLGFLPWGRLSALTTSGGTIARRLPADLPTLAQAAMVVALLAQQIAFSTWRIERSPMFTYYPMYSSTYANSAEFDAAMVPYYRIVVSTDTGDVELPCDAPEDLVEQFRAALEGSSEAAEHIWRAVRGCGRDLDAARRVTLEGDRHVFDWKRLQFNTSRAAVVLGPLPIDAAAAQGRH